MKKTFLSKILVFCLILTLVLSLAACGSKEEPKEEPAETEEKEEEPEEVEEPAEKEEPEQVETPVPEDLLGKITDTSYVNDHFGLRCDVPADWYILSKEEVATITGVAISNIDDEAILDMFKNNGYVTDFYAMETTPAIEGTDSFNNVNITIQDVGKLYGIVYDEKQLAEASVSAVEQSLKAQGATDIKTEISETEFIGKNYVCMTITSKIGDVNMYQKQVYLKDDSIIAAITATTLGEDKTDAMLAAFKDSTAPATETTPAAATNTDTSSADAGAMKDATLASGQISIDGDIFTLGKGFNEIPAEWTLKPEDAEKYKDYTLNPRTTSGSAMGVYKEKWGYEFNSFHVMLSLVNASEASIPYLEGAIDYLDIPGISRSETVPNIIFPGGLTLESTEEDFIAAYGEPSNEYEDASTQFKKLSFRDGDVKLDIIWSKGAIDQITIMY